MKPAIEILKKLKAEEIHRLFNRSVEYLDFMDDVAGIVETVISEGDDALLKFTEKFDGVKLSALEIKEEEIKSAMDEVDPDLLIHLKLAHKNILAFHLRQKDREFWMDEITDGITLGQKRVPIESVGAYVPAGYPSTALMTVTPAKVAGVPNIVVTTAPGKDGTVDPLLITAAKIAGADRIFKVGGAQAIGALASGTETIPAVSKIVGPGNVYVTAAKMYVRSKGYCEIDFPAGPSEILILADSTADCNWIITDMLAQEEHDKMAISILLTTSRDLAETVSEALDATQTRIFFIETLDEGIEFINQFAPEHLEILTEDPLIVLESVRSAGSIFLGGYSPVAAGDYASGTNHVLPTAGYGRLHSGLSLDSFMKTMSIQMLTKRGLEGIRDAAVALAKREGFDAHATSIMARFREER
ncbi:MAG: bifunctional histidinal dehydrogenase/ histidinol dehydrogenase [Candidatus Syntrophoarchaeum sp. GoM_oil]|nr:MAG: bifunctional histidinal dehydrogenase/ histidinol dehydrogenase [Candidatus Syntrophoarchaeum sp. GoM_oil]